MCVNKDNSVKKCGGCGVAVGEFHQHNCDVEECPFCHGQLAFCACAAIQLGLSSTDDLTAADMDIFERKLTEKGLIPFGSENPNHPDKNYRIAGINF